MSEPFTQVQSSFGKGEIAADLYGRIDVQMYSSALKSARNCIIHPYGGASNRPGTLLVGPVKEHDFAPRLIGFEFKTSDVYELEFGNLYMRVIRDNAHVLDSATIVNITAITQANPIHVTTGTAHTMLAGDEVFLSGIVGMTRLNGNRYKITNVTANAFDLVDQVTGAAIDGTDPSYAAYVSGGTSGRIFTLVTPYAAADLSRLKFVQDADVMTLTHPSYAIRELGRIDHDDWTLTIPTFAPAIASPTGEAVSPTTTGSTVARYQVTAVAASNGEESLPGLNNTSKAVTAATLSAGVAVRLTVVAHGFLDGDEVQLDSLGGITGLNGRRFTVAGKTTDQFYLLNESSDLYISTPYTSGGTAHQTFVRITNSADIASDAIKTVVTWAAVTGAASYNIYRESGGIFGLVGSSTGLTFLDANYASNGVFSPPASRDPFRIAGQYPGAVGFYEQRKVYGGSVSKPDTANYSKTGYSSNFSQSTPRQDDDAFEVQLASQKVNEIRHFMPATDLLIFTGGSEWRANRGGSTEGFSFRTLDQKPQSIEGVSHIAPIVIGQTIIFVTEAENQLRSFEYSLSLNGYAGGYTGTNLGLLAPHLLEFDTIRDLCKARTPDTRAYMPISDGTLLTLTYDKEQQVTAWTPWDTQGSYERCGSLRHGPDSPLERVYFVVQRFVNGQLVRFIERMDDRRFDDPRDQHFVDCGLVLDNPIDIEAITLGAPINIKSTAHGLVTGDEVDIADIIWVDPIDASGSEIIPEPEQLNYARFTVTRVDADNVTLDGTDGSTFNVYANGGVMRKAVSHLTGLDYLEQSPIIGIADGNVFEATVMNGRIDLARPASRIHLGLQFISDIETLAMEVPQGTAIGLKKAAPEITIRLKCSRGLLIGQDSQHLDEMKDRDDENYDEPIDLFTGDHQQPIDSNWAIDGHIFIRQKYPLAMTVLAIAPNWTMEG